MGGSHDCVVGQAVEHGGGGKSGRVGAGTIVSERVVGRRADGAALVGGRGESEQQLVAGGVERGEPSSSTMT